jgi:hypothetical protein
MAPTLREQEGGHQAFLRRWLKLSGRHFGEWLIGVRVG